MVCSVGKQLFTSHPLMSKVTQHLRIVARKPSLYVFSKDTVSPKYFPVLLVESTATESLDSKDRLCTQIP